MSNRLLNLVWGAQSFGEARDASTQRLVMAALADYVDETRHVDWCYPSLQAIMERTDLARRTLIYTLGKLKAGGWITTSERPGYGSAYHFDVTKLEDAQRPKREGRIQRTRAFTAPVQSTETRGALNGEQGCNERSANKEEAVLKQEEKQQVFFDPSGSDCETVVVASVPSVSRVAVMPKRSSGAQVLLDADVESIRLAYPRKIAPVPARQAIRKHHASLLAGKVTTALGAKLPAMTCSEATAYLLDRTRAYASGPLPADQQHIPYPATWFNQGGYTVDVGPGHNPSSSQRPASALDKMARRGL